MTCPLPGSTERTFPRLAAFRAGTKYLLIILLWFSGFPVSLGNMRSSSKTGHCNRHRFNAVKVEGPRSILRMELLDFGAYQANDSGLDWSVRKKSCALHGSSGCEAPGRVAEVSLISDTTPAWGFAPARSPHHRFTHTKATPSGGALPI
jgi:hypothetical protein